MSIIIHVSFSKEEENIYLSGSSKETRKKGDKP